MSGRAPGQDTVASGGKANSEATPIGAFAPYGPAATHAARAPHAPDNPAETPAEHIRNALQLLQLAERGRVVEVDRGATTTVQMGAVVVLDADTAAAIVARLAAALRRLELAGAYVEVMREFGQDLRAASWELTEAGAIATAGATLLQDGAE